MKTTALHPLEEVSCCRQVPEYHERWTFAGSKNFTPATSSTNAF